jgi:type 1 glutamine amidotransferase/nicotinamidase-related amidase
VRGRTKTGWTRSLATACLLATAGWAGTALGAENREPLALRLRSRAESQTSSGRFRVIEKAEYWTPAESAIIVCDMWDLHHCRNAVRRVEEMAPRMDLVLKAARARGVTIIHAPSSCMGAYKDHPARIRAVKTPRARNLPEDIGQWCRQISAEARGTYPIDQSNGGEDDDPAEHAEWAAKLAAMGRDPRAPWKSQTGLLTIDPAADYISDEGAEIWSILDGRGIKNVVLLGVHLNMCVLGRPFGLRQMARNGKHVVVMRDMTDTMYDPRSAPFVSHFAGTDLMLEHIEKYVCPSIASDQIVGGMPFRFKDDRRLDVAFLIAEDEYQTEISLPVFAAENLAKEVHVEYVLGNEADRNDLPGLNVLDDADVAIISVRRRVLPEDQLDLIRRFVADGKGIVGIRTASHAFTLRPRDVIPAGKKAWTEFDPDVLGGHYTNHHGVGPKVTVRTVDGASGHPILEGLDPSKLVGHGSLYKVSPIARTATALLIGSIPGQAEEPVAWTNAPPSKNRVFYTSLGHPDDFGQPDFNRLLHNAIYWAAGHGRPGSAPAGVR